ncbi:MAG TPA: DUF2905 domain-containing protein [Myxococcota bacterium]|nr:DUF2905 domain-containing protein [Myxococcota bacterium]
MSIARTLILIGGALVALGLLLQIAPHIPLLGKLPGDIRIEREGYSLYFPIVTCLLLSAIVTLVMQLIERMK